MVYAGLYMHDWGEEHHPSCWAEAKGYSCLSFSLRLGIILLGLSGSTRDKESVVLILSRTRIKYGYIVYADVHMLGLKKERRLRNFLGSIGWRRW